jgi:hypothetical protein
MWLKPAQRLIQTLQAGLAPTQSHRSPAARRVDQVGVVVNAGAPG